jgi:phosphatidyl-myo-inositol alpha-mannosyltransferase
MRVGIVCPYSLSVPGGVQGQVLGLARSLRRRGHEVRVLAPVDGPPPEAGITPLGRSIPTAANGSVAPLAVDPAAARRTIRALREEAFDVVHLHEPLAPGPTLTTLVVKPAPLVGTFHAAGESAAYRWLGPIVRRLGRRLDRRIAVSDDARRLAEPVLGGRWTVAFNGVDVDAFSGVDPFPTEGPTVLFVGRHEPRKGLEVLLEARHHLPESVRIWVAGTGPQTDELRAGVGDDPRVEWLGRIDDREKARRLRAADVFCAPSLGGESFGVVLLEAMAAGTPVVASDLPGYRNAARPDFDALLVPPGDQAALAVAIVRVLDDRSLVAGLVASGRQRAESFSMDRLAAWYEEVYAGLVAAGSH